MVLLYIYLGTVAIAIASAHISDRYIEKEIENRGYEYKEEKKNIYKTIMDNIKVYSVLTFPIVGFVFGMFCFFTTEDFCNKYIEEHIKDGKLIKKKEKEEPKLIEAVEIDNNLVEDSKIIVYKVDDKQKKEMTREEKIAFLKEEYNRLTGNQIQSENINQKKIGLGKKRK